MKILIVEDDFTSRKLLLALLSSYGECDVAVNGEEALVAFDAATDDGDPYSLVCLDIMMPVMDGQETLAEIRNRESLAGVQGLDGVKIIMTTALDDSQNVMTAFRSQCEGYLVKPIGKADLTKLLTSLGIGEV